MGKVFIVSRGGTGHEVNYDIVKVCSTLQIALDKIRELLGDEAMFEYQGGRCQTWEINSEWLELTIWNVDEEI